jgi:hypothetical protein
MYNITGIASVSVRPHSRQARPGPCPASQTDRRDRSHDDLHPFLNGKHLAQRWRHGRGPARLRLGRRGLYTLRLVCAHEAAALGHGEGEE